METEHVPVRHWIATLRRNDGSRAENRIPIDGVDLVEAAVSANIQAKQRFSEAIRIEVLE